MYKSMVSENAYEHVNRDKEMWHLFGSNAVDASDEEGEDITFVGKYDLPISKDGKDIGEEKVKKRTRMEIPSDAIEDTHARAKKEKAPFSQT